MILNMLKNADCVFTIAVAVSTQGCGCKNDFVNNNKYPYRAYVQRGIIVIGVNVHVRVRVKLPHPLVELQYMHKHGKILRFVTSKLFKQFLFSINI